MLNFINTVRNEKVALPYRLQGIKSELCLLSYVFQGLLSFYCFPDTSIADQIKSFSSAAHSLVYLYRESKSKLFPNQLIHDIQATFQDAIFCCVKSKEYSPEKPLYLVKNRTDSEESFFGVVRANHKNTNLDNMEFIHCASAMSQVDHILINQHPEWTKGGRLSKRLCLDHSSIDNWEKEKLILADTDISGMFKVGKLKVSAMILESGLKDIDFDDLSRKGVTFMKPFAKIIGVDDSEVDWSIPPPDDTDAVATENADCVDEAHGSGGEEDATDNAGGPSDKNEDEGEEADINLGDYISTHHEATVEIDGKHVYKATCVKDAFTSQPLSKDRLKRVRTFTTPSFGEAPPKLLHIGDPVVVTGGDKLANIMTIRHGNKAVKFIDMNLLEANNLKFELKQLELVEKEDKYFWTGEFAGDAFTVTGKDCIPIQPEVFLEIDAIDCTPYAFDKQLVLDIGVHLHQQPSDKMASVSGNASCNTNVSPLRTCYLCQKKCTLDMMRGHVAFHIIKEECEDVCGFCGRGGTVCQTVLKPSSRKGGKAYFEVDSSCDYKHAYKRVPADVTKTHKCTNKVITCPANNCGHYVWKYNGAHHYNNKHPALPIPTEFNISEKEKDTVLKTYKI